MALEFNAEQTESLSERQERIRNRADAWLERHKPLLGSTMHLGLDDVQASLSLVRQLKDDAPEILAELRAVADPTQDAARTLSVAESLTRLDSVEQDLRGRLTDLDPASPDALMDTPERAAIAREARSRQAVERRLERMANEPLELTLSEPNRSEATSLGGFAAFWNGFTLLHGAAMIGGFWAAFGPVALALLLFYSIFIAVGVAVTKAAMDAMTMETLRLDSNLLAITQSRGKRHKVNLITLGPKSEVRDVTRTVKQKGKSGREFVIVDAHGKEHRFGSRTPDGKRDSLLQRINEAIYARRTVW
ncbi:MAG: hypothetical protein QM758_28085 [Armatimonas sp.]